MWLDGGTLSVVVCDGAGGIPGGGRAADLGCSGLIRGLPADPVPLLRALDRHIEDDPLAGECTAVAVVAGPDGVRGASCGDSDAFLDGAVLTGEQHRKRRLGSGRALPVAFIGRGRRLLVCTDGLSGVVRGPALSAALKARHLTRAADALVAAARLPGGDLLDDLAFVLVDLD